MINKFIAPSIVLSIVSTCLYGVRSGEFKNAVENGEIEMVRQMLNREQILLQTVFSEAGELAMHVAAQNGHLGIAVLLNLQGVPYDQRDNFQETALHKAVRNGHYELVQHLLSQESSLMSLRDAQGATPLYRAVEHGHSAIVSLFLDAGALVTVVDGMTELTMLEMAALNGCPQIFGKLFSVIGCLTVRNSRALSALFFYAIKGGNEEIVRFLLGQGADVNGIDAVARTPLHVAALHGHAQLIRLLLDNGALVNMADAHGRKALDIAVTHQHNSIAQLLRAARPNDQLSSQGDPCEREKFAQKIRRLLVCCCQSR